MDARTGNLLHALDRTALEILLALLEAPLTEKDLLPKVRSGGQSAVHKKLGQLAREGVIRRTPNEGKRGRLWSVVAPGPTASSIQGILALADALDEADAQARQAARSRLNAVGKTQSKLRVVDASNNQ
jgi:predicted transcriptional regulator